MLKAFGATVNRKLSKNTCECLPILDSSSSRASRHRLIDACQNATAFLLAGKGIDTAKIKAATEKHAPVINLVRLHKLLVGELTFETLAALPALTKEMLKGDAYEMAVLAREGQGGSEQSSSTAKAMDQSQSNTTAR